MSDIPAGEGWHFHRNDDGSVHITAASPSLTLDPAAWASTVAALSARGETGDTVRQAHAFHQMQPRRMETV